MKVLITTTAPPNRSLGGPGKFCSYLMDGLSNSPDIEAISCIGGETHQNTQSKKSKAIISQILRDGVYKKFISESVKLLARKIIDTRKSNQLIKTIENKKIDLIHAHDFESVALANKTNKPIILTNHFKGSFYKEYVQFLPGKERSEWEKYFLDIEKKAIARADIITFPSISAMELLNEDHPNFAREIKSKSKIIYSGIPETGTLPPQRIEKYVINIGNHIPDKGIDLAIELFTELFHDSPDIRLINIGEPGPETEKIKSIIKNKNIENRVKLLGKITHQELLQLLRGALYFIHTPRRVVFDLSLLEAMSLEIPIIASTARGNIEALGTEHPLTITIKSHNNWDKNFQKIILTDEKLKIDLIKHQKKRFSEKFSFEAMIKSYSNLYLATAR